MFLSRSFVGCSLTALSLAACARPELPAASRLTPEVGAAELRTHVEVLASDSLRGRRTGTPGATAAATYLATELQRLGLRPAGDQGTFYHRVPLVERRTVLDLQLETSTGSRTVSSEEALPVSGIAGLPGTTRTSGEGPLVYGGYLIDPAVEEDELDPAVLAGAVVMLHAGPAPGVEGGTPRIPLARLFTPQSPAQAVLIIVEKSEDLWHYAADIARRGALELSPKEETRGDLPAFFLISAELAEELLREPLGNARAPRTGLGQVSFGLRESLSPVDAWNIVAMLPGRDPVRAGQLVALGAHYDHVGVGEPVEGDSIYNGADDDASGSAALLEVAERFATAPRKERPARSMLFVWHTAEEAGLLGSESFTDMPTVPRDSIVVQINLDMVGRNAPDSLLSVGSRRLSTELGDVVESVNRKQPSPFLLDYSYDDPQHPERVYCRSDHYNYARFGIPVVFFTTGLHADYHQPSDEPDKVDYEKLARVTRFIGDLARELGDRSSPPRVDRSPAASECR